MEPQVFDLLAFLICRPRPHRQQRRDSRRVWHGRIVSEAALSSRINAARKAIGDNGNDQILIRTFHKRGFRFVGESIERADEAGAGVPTAQPSAPGRRLPDPSPPGIATETAASRRSPSYLRQSQPRSGARLLRLRPHRGRHPPAWPQPLADRAIRHSAAPTVQGQDVTRADRCRARCPLSRRGQRAQEAAITCASRPNWSRR